MDSLGHPSLPSTDLSRLDDEEASPGVRLSESTTAEDCGFQKLNDDEIVTSVQEESDPVDDERDEDEGNNESSKGPSNVDAFSALQTAME
ncbi:hypothetical protein TNCV_4957311 [Trichonephila clavipes]|nr:hypothetical protein TNCV_4957311 [Trichonephila clavipes]